MTILQLSPEAAASGGLLFLLLTGLILLMILALILRWIFRVDEHLANQKAAVWLLINLCLKAGVDQESIDSIRKVFKIK